MRIHTSQSGMVVQAPREKPAPRPVKEKTPSGLVSVVPRIRRDRFDALKALSKETRISQSALLREAIEDVLRKHGEGE
jgi:hypothetical protein